MLFRKAFGFKGETIVASYLKKNGYKIIKKNYSCCFGEIDIIAQKDEFVAFVEVKTRRKKYFEICDVVNKSKQRKIIKTAKVFLSKYSSWFEEKVFRFDVATVLCTDIENDENSYKIEYIENAFMEGDAFMKGDTFVGR